MSRTKALNKKAHTLRIKEKRLKQQSALLSQGIDLLRAAEEKGRVHGTLEGLSLAHQILSSVPAKGAKQKALSLIAEEAAHLQGG